MEIEDAALPEYRAERWYSGETGRLSWHFVACRAICCMYAGVDLHPPAQSGSNIWYQGRCCWWGIQSGKPIRCVPACGCDTSYVGAWTYRLCGETVFSAHDEYFAASLQIACTSAMTAGQPGVYLPSCFVLPVLHVDTMYWGRCTTTVAFNGINVHRLSPWRS